jgi:hypothetical protein
LVIRRPRVAPLGAHVRRHRSFRYDMWIFVPPEGWQRIDLTHSPARGNDFFIWRMGTPRFSAVFKLQSYAGFKEAGRATGRTVALTESALVALQDTSPRC